MQFGAWKAALINEIEIAAEGRAELALADPDDPRIEKSQKALFDLAEQLRALPSDHATLKALFREEAELSNLMRATVGEPERRYRDAKEDLLAAGGIDHERFDNVADVIVRQAYEVRVRRHRLFELIGDLSRITRDDAETHEHAGIPQDRVRDLRVELIDVLMLALHKVFQAKNSDGWISVHAAPRIFSLLVRRSFQGAPRARGPRDAGRPTIEPGLVFVTLLPPAVFGPRRLARLGRLLENDTGIIDTC